MIVAQSLAASCRRYIRLAGTRSDPRVVGSEATPVERDLMKSVMPDVYPSITFTKFGL